MRASIMAESALLPLLPAVGTRTEQGGQEGCAGSEPSR